jgi:hypothetical protein
MPRTHHRMRGGRSRPSGDLRPYFFTREPADLFEEAFGELLKLRTSDAHPRAQHNIEQPNDLQQVVREQRTTLFAHDVFMQQVFGGDLDAYIAAVDDAAVMHDALAIFLHRQQGQADDATTKHCCGGHDASHEGGSPPRSVVHRSFEDRLLTSRSNEDAEDDGLFETDPTYDASAQWACRVERWAQSLFALPDTHDRDLYRVIVNVLQVPAKVAFGMSCGPCVSRAELSIAAVGYSQARTFLIRTLESLAACFGKGIGGRDSVHEFLDEGRELLADIESRLADITAAITQGEDDAQ